MKQNSKPVRLDFMKYKLLFFIVSAIFLVPSIYALVFWGLKPAIDFTGGTIIEIRNEKLDIQNVDHKVEIENALKEEDSQLASIQNSGEKTFILKTKEINKDKKELVLSKLKNTFGEIEEIRFETVGPTIGKELIKKTIISIFLAAGFILFYVAYSFKEKRYGVCAILAMFHDTLILLGTFSILGHFFKVEVDTLFVTAVLTILSFSVHDTVVVYDRIRESVKLHPKAKFYDLVNKAVAETLTRSVNNSLTIIFMLLALYLLGGETIKWFVFALLIGTIAGTYSSTFTAAPLLVLWEKISNKSKKKN
ncbi:protein translocase subunit SecF [Patescibacteria group bacterium]